MLLDFSRLLCLTVLEWLRRARAGLPVHLPLTALVLSTPARLGELHCAWRMGLMVRRMQAMGRRIELVHTELRSGRNVSTILGDAHFRSMLAVVRDDMRVLHGEALAWRGERPCVRLAAALEAVQEVSGQVHGMADGLLAALAEYDKPAA